MAIMAVTVFVAALLQKSSDPVTLIAKYQGQEVGTATIETTVLSDKSWVRSFDSKLSLNGAVFETHMKSHFSKDGRLVNIEDRAALDNEPKHSVTIVFTQAGAEMTDKLTGDKKSFPAPASPPTLDPSDLWFIKVTPKIGDKAVASSFSEEDGWRTTTVTYVGDKPYKLGDKLILAHRIQHDHPKESYEELVDDQGLDLEIEPPGATGLHFSRKQTIDLEYLTGRIGPVLAHP